MWTYNYSNELYHYGVKGMKWGIRKKYKPHPRKPAKKQDDNDESKSKFKLTDKQKKALKIGAAVAATALVAYGGYKLYQNREGIANNLYSMNMKRKMGKKNMDFINSDANKYLGKGKQIVEGMDLDVDIETGFNKLSSTPSSISQAIKGGNPTGSRTNCRACAVNAFMRLTGRDTVALDIPGGSFSDAINACFNGAKITEMYNPTKERITNNILRKYKEGDVGAIASTFRLRGDDFEHAYNWKIEQGAVKFFDSQKELDDFSEYLNLLSPNKMTEIVKLSGLEINTEGVKNFIKNRI